tara:strand:- start:446 stop:577 length:132 start_codon:yes stop_codon:yes gene_type:complete
MLIILKISTIPTDVSVLRLNERIFTKSSNPSALGVEGAVEEGA